MCGENKEDKVKCRCTKCNNKWEMDKAAAIRATITCPVCGGTGEIEVH